MHPSYPPSTEYLAPAPPDPSTASTYYYQGYPVDPRDPNAALVVQAPASPWLDVTNPSFLTGLLVGTGATLMVTSPAVQNAVVKGAVAVWSAVVGGLEEIKERIRDATAEKSQS